MTPSEREQVVELIRVAADTDEHGLLNGFLGVEADYPEACREAAWSALCAVRDSSLDMVHGEETWRWRLLEAAQRVEEGSWP